MVCGEYLHKCFGLLFSFVVGIYNAFSKKMMNRICFLVTVPFCEREQICFQDTVCIQVQTLGEGFTCLQEPKGL